MNFGTGFLVDNRPRPEFHDEHNANHDADFDFYKIEVGDRGIITFKENCIDPTYTFSNFQVVVIEKSAHTITTKLDVNDGRFNRFKHISPNRHLPFRENLTHPAVGLPRDRRQPHYFFNSSTPFWD